LRDRFATKAPGDGARRVVLALSVALLAAGPAAAQSAPGEPPSESDPRVPLFLRGVDQTLPSQDAFRGWPPTELVERPYWLPWNPFSFQRAHVFGRPILLMLTVPWNRDSQRLETETLADKEVLRAINDGFVAIRVDADRRPDIRERYGAASLPVISLVLPDGRPILSQANPAGEALPIRAGFLDRKRMLFLLGEGRTYYERWPDLLRSVGERWLRTSGDPDVEGGSVDLEASNRIARWLAGNADHAAGGFGLAPKRVVPGLAEYAAMREDRGEADLAEHARATLEKLVGSPLYDRRDGGVHRLAAAPEWGSIQYEKTLQSNVDLVRDLTFALRRSDSDALRKALAGTCRFLTTVLARPGGGFFTAQAADPKSEDGGGYWAAGASGDSRPPIAPLVLAGENARAGAALLRASAVLGDPSLAEAGRGALALVLERSYASARGVDHVVEPAPERRRFLETQADTALALLDAYDATGERDYLRAARDLAGFTVNNLGGAGEAMLRDHLAEPGPIGMLASPRHPRGPNARMARVLNRLAVLDGSDPSRERARGILGAFLGDPTSLGEAQIEAGLAAEEIAGEPLRIEIRGAPGSQRAAALRAAALALPYAWTVISSTDDENGGRKTDAVLRRGASSERVDRPDRLAAAAQKVMAARAARSGS
jgi:hypothetical protein